MRHIILIYLGFALWMGAAFAATPQKGAVASAHPLATAAGIEILNAGGNAFDAAVAVSAALAVVEPYSSGIGGGGFWLLHRARDGMEVMVDGRERAPLAAHRALFLDQDGNVTPQLSVDGPLAAGIPGEPAALAHIAVRNGTLPLSRLLAPAITLAQQGFEVTPHYRQMAGFRMEALQGSDAQQIFLDQGALPALGHLIRQPDLAGVLQRLAQQGAAGFYQGEVAQRLVDAVRQQGGIWQLQDLADYRVVERRPIHFNYRGFKVTAAPPPSSGGVALATMLQILEQLGPWQPATDYPRTEVEQTHLLIEAMRRAYRDRAQYLGDSDFVEVPVERLTHPYYAAGLAATIHQQRATPSDTLPPVSVDEGGNDTTHLSILDREGNYVSATLSINYPFGSGFVAAGTGVLLNDEMDDFSSKPGSANVYGLVGAEANAIEPGKRMLSSMSPTFMRSQEGVAILGTPGGSRIITMVLLGMLEAAQGHEVERWVARPRIHHQYLPDTLLVEPEGLSLSVQQQLTAMGHTIKESDRTWGNMQAIRWQLDSGVVTAASDPRGEGSSQLQ